MSNRGLLEAGLWGYFSGNNTISISDIISAVLELHPHYVRRWPGPYPFPPRICERAPLEGLPSRGAQHRLRTIMEVLLGGRVDPVYGDDNHCLCGCVGRGLERKPLFVQARHRQARHRPRTAESNQQLVIYRLSMTPSQSQRYTVLIRVRE